MMLSVSAAVSIVLKREKDTEAERASGREPGRGTGEGEKDVGGCRRCPTEGDLARCEGARATGPVETDGWRAMLVVMRRRVSSDGASSSSLHQSERR